MASTLIAKIAKASQAVGALQPDKTNVQQNGWKNVSAEDAKLLATCSWLTVSQREALTAKFAA